MCVWCVSPVANQTLVPLSGPQVSVQDQDEHRQVSSRHHGAHPQAGPQIPAGLQRPERHCEYED